MANGHNVLWTDHALDELEEALEYLQKNWTERELKKFSRELDHTIELISKNPNLFQASNTKKGVRRAVILKYNKLYYRVNKNSVELLSLFATRKDPFKRKLK